jgi:hypothetical protein
MSDGTTMLKATLGTMLEVMLGTTLEATLGMMLGKPMMETRRETTAKMKTGFLILVATHDLQNLPVWMTLEKLRFVFDPCHPTLDLPNNFRQRRCANGDRTTANTSNATCLHERNLLFFDMVRGGPNVFCRLPIHSPFGRFYDEADTTHQISWAIIVGRGQPKYFPATQTECAINFVSASHNLRQLCCDNVVSSMTEC